jgi:hypothetical protein
VTNVSVISTKTVSFPTMSDDSVERVTIRLSIQCEHCGEAAVKVMTPEQARRTASGLEAAARRARARRGHRDRPQRVKVG